MVNEDGRLPERTLYDSPRSSNLERLKIERSISPSSLLKENYNSSKVDRCPTSGGMCPRSLFSPMLICSIFDILPIEYGIVPAMWFSLRHSDDINLSIIRIIEAIGRIF